jgi:uncharacterized protein (TIGR02145 family)
MKKRMLIYPLLFMGIVLILVDGCKKDTNNSTTQETGTVTDVDGNVYKTVKIGTQWWMAENLKTIHYRNGVSVPNVTDNTQWSNLTTGAYCDYNNISSNSTIYGKLYNWYAVVDSRNLCPTGWHIPTDAEWTTLITYLGGDGVAGGKLKETGTVHWLSPNTGATNEKGFNALPGGASNSNGSFSGITYGGFWWSSTEYTVTDAWHSNMLYGTSNVYRVSSSKAGGLSVRCVKD